MLKLLVSTAAGLFLTGALSASEGWITDMDAAMAQAEREGKYILMDFTGSDWCHWCIKLRDEVFTKESFQAEAPKHFVLVELDFPRRTELDPEQKAHNQKWMEKFGIQGFPTIILADADGEGFARTGYREGGPDAYLEHLGELRGAKTELDGLLAKAERASGVERAKLLDQALQVDDVQVADRAATMEQIIALDADGAAGLKAKYEAELLGMKMDEDLTQIERTLAQDGPEAAMGLLKTFEETYPNPGSRLGNFLRAKIIALHMCGEVDEAMTLIDTTLDDDKISNSTRQEVAMVAFQVYMQEGDGAKATSAIERALAFDPESDLGKMLSKDKDRILQMIRERTSDDSDDSDG